MPAIEEAKRVSILMPTRLLLCLDTLANEWGIESRGEALVKLLDQIFCEDEEGDDVQADV